MRLEIRLGPSTLRTLIFTVGTYLTIATGPAVFGQTPDVLPDAFHDGLGVGDSLLARSARQIALETRRSQETAEWRSAATGTSGTVTPLRTFRIVSGAFCREFRETLIFAGSSTERVGTACRRSDDIWIRVEP